jgi:two-component system sensor histidine kinase RegB
MIPVSEESLKLRWLAGARWWTCIGLSLAFLIGRSGIGLTLDPGPFATVLLIFVTSNITSYILPEAPTQKLLGPIIIADVILFTALLYFYGGSTNPLCSVYFLYVILASILLPSALWGWAIASLCSACFALLFVFFLPIPELASGHAHHHNSFSTHLQGMLITFVFTAFVIVYFISRLTSALRSREQNLEHMREKSRHNERLAALTTLAAGAAHELRNPLATIAISAGELESELRESTTNPDILVETKSIREAVGRCQKIIDGLSGNAGIVAGEPVVTTSVKMVISEVLGQIPDPSSVNVHVSPDIESSTIQTFASSLAQALLSLVRNGLEYGKVTLKVTRTNKVINFFVEDIGPGIPEKNIARIGEPFFTTKGAGKGMGLGVFITKTFAERIGGSLSFSPRNIQGTIAILSVPDAL